MYFILLINNSKTGQSCKHTTSEAWLSCYWLLDVVVIFRWCDVTALTCMNHQTSRSVLLSFVSCNGWNVCICFVYISSALVYHFISINNWSCKCSFVFSHYAEKKTNISVSHWMLKSNSMSEYTVYSWS